jgi:phospholipase D1/2
VDGRVGFVGGLDFSAGVWDDRTHRAVWPDRCDSGQEPHAPYHDVQAFVSGEAAAELARYFARRWQRAGGEPLELPAAEGELEIAFRPSVAIPGGPVALSEIRPPTLTEPGGPTRSANFTSTPSTRPRS